MQLLEETARRREPVAGPEPTHVPHFPARAAAPIARGGDHFAHGFHVVRMAGWTVRRRADYIVRSWSVAHGGVVQARVTCSARGPLGPWPFSNETDCPSRRSSKRTPSQADWWKKYSLPSWAATKPKPLSVTSRLIVPLVAAIETLLRYRDVRRDAKCADRMALMSAGASSVNAGGATVPGKRPNIVHADRHAHNGTLGCLPALGGKWAWFEPSRLCGNRLDGQRHADVVADQEPAGLERGVPVEPELLTVDC